MPLETALTVSVIVLAFVAFGAALAWAEYQSRRHRQSHG
jgi:hypothetical protein